MGEDDASDMNRDDNDGNAGVEVKTTPRFNSGADIEICFFHAEAKDPEDMDPQNDDEHQDETELAERAVGIEADVTSLSTLAQQQTETVQQGNSFESIYLSCRVLNTFESTSIFCPRRQNCARNQFLRHLLPAHTHQISIYSFIKMDQIGSRH